MDAFIAGAWRTPSRGEILIGGAWRRLTRGEAYIGGSWRTTASFIPPLSLSVSPTVFGFRYTTKPMAGLVTSNPASATPTGGAAPYTYIWTIIEGAVSIGSPTNASTAFSATLAANTERDAVARVTCTDALGATATGTTSINLQNQSGF